MTLYLRQSLLLFLIILLRLCGADKKRESPRLRSWSLGDFGGEFLKFLSQSRTLRPSICRSFVVYALVCP
ncbi:hypothetical protein GCK32_015059 [Trichostrongylus colubriformis]|uniref:Uncharacterized protein n=1 Tax=Trichostrongylus colubriformis TaxID=6319 RepID=A0AAN8EWR8_TRICO